MDYMNDMDCSTSSASADYAAGKIKRRRFSSARVQPTRIKKVMQSDEDIGRMVASVPVAIGSAMEQFAEVRNEFLELLWIGMGSPQGQKSKNFFFDF
jgi:hypothetical protein